MADPTFLYLFTPTLSPGTLNDVSVTAPVQRSARSTATRPNAFFADFLDVPQIDPFHDYVEKIVPPRHNGGLRWRAATAGTMPSLARRWRSSF